MNRLLLVVGVAVALFAVVAVVVVNSCGQVGNPGLIRVTDLEHRPATEHHPEQWIVTVVNEHGTTQSFPVTKDRFRRCRIGEPYPLESPDTAEEIVSPESIPPAKPTAPGLRIRRTSGGSVPAFPRERTGRKPQGPARRPSLVGWPGALGDFCEEECDVYGYNESAAHG
jgi:hypothetical protein